MPDRYLPNIIDQIIPLLPPEYASVAHTLESLKSSAYYAAPESEPFLWRALSSTLRLHLGEPDVGWKRRIQDIVVGKPV